jgi:hypothetical protein
MIAVVTSRLRSKPPRRSTLLRFRGEQTAQTCAMAWFRQLSCKPPDFAPDGVEPTISCCQKIESLFNSLMVDISCDRRQDMAPWTMCGILGRPLVHIAPSSKSVRRDPR